jgi:hypothetical protein
MASEAESVLAIDFKVLPHLGGYPEDLHRYANLMKQAHPRGISAVEFLLKRPQAPDGFLEATCRFVRDGVDILTGVEVAPRVGRSPQAFLDEVASQSVFPAPLYRKADRGIWRAQDVETYLDRQASENA